MSNKNAKKFLKSVKVIVKDIVFSLSYMGKIFWLASYHTSL